MTHIDQITLAQRRQEALDMNAAHLDMARRLRGKMSVAIDAIVPELLKPSDINSLVKTAAELERKAGIDSEALQLRMSEGWVDESQKELKRSDTPTNDLAEVAAILAKAGALGDITRIGVKTTETKTTEMVAMGEEDDL